MTKQELELKKRELQTELQEIDNKLDNFEYEEKKAQYGDKFTCEYCKYGAIQDLSGDGWHNTCGAHNCTCCHTRCVKYEPDNEVTLFIKQNIRAKGNGIFRSKHTNGYGYINDTEYKALKDLVGDIFKPINKSEKMIKVLKACFGISEETK